MLSCADQNWEKFYNLDFNCLISFQHSHVSMAEVIGLLGGRYSEADKIVEVSVCLFTFSVKYETVRVIYIIYNIYIG